MTLSYVTAFKICAAALIWVLALAGGIGPMLLLRASKHNSHTDSRATSRAALATSVLNMFAGGIFLSGACLHLLPDAQENDALAHWHCASDSGDDCFKWANFFFGIGFLLVLLLEVFAHALQHTFGDTKSSSNAIGTESQTPAHEHTPLVLSSALDSDRHLELQRHHQRHESCSSEDTDVSISPRAHAPVQDDSTVAAMVCDPTLQDHDLDIDLERSAHSDMHWHKDAPATAMYGSVGVTHQDKQQHSYRAVHDDSYSTSLTAPTLDKHCADADITHSHMHGMLDSRSDKPVLALVVFLALSFHSVMEGMGVGASSHATWDILAAILAHKSLAAFALTQELVHHGVARRQALVTIGMFSLMTPVGILLGALLVDTSTETIGSGICTALAGGTFLFVATIEVIPQELQRREHLLPKCAALLAGYSAMSTLSLWT